ncbi:hypothetical protein NEOLEDRAFT_1183156 [Neolentinus lepideus HHB14362 ss-1]|uniref:Uncharacterized protein n=1 Tax=Neolentinus lepideus HHB14362 ss-1 TaxID=1314782 RepID=A0A165NID2_9AGAM|nr:hypothetical protein NEOLEDRAFT_1183156 [Neolentinus lepideus HHB14362 ss-1]
MFKRTAKKKARRLTPASDAESVIIPEDPHASPPPSQVQPIIRQAVGFGSALENSAAIPMYKATVSEQPVDRYLPGQAIGQPQPPTPVIDDFRRSEDRASDHQPPEERQQLRFSAFQIPGQSASSSDAAGSSRGKRKPKSSTARKKKREEPFAGQVDKFRVSYNMGFTLPSQGQGNANSAPATSDSLDTYSSVTSPHPAMPNVVRDYSRFFQSPPPSGSSHSVEPPASSPAPVSSKGKGKAKAGHKSAPKSSNRTSSKSSGVTSTTLSARQLEKQPMRNDSRSPAPSKTDQSKYYRYDYDRQRAITPTLPSEYTSQASPQVPSPAAASNGYGVGSPKSSALSGNAMNSPSNTERRAPAPGRPRILKLVTLLIEDLRSGVTDKQIAEVRVALRPHDEPECGFWGDAGEIAEQLQAGPSRIDGPARVFSRRGEYRQFFLRVSEDNVDTIAKANLPVDKLLCAEVFVEPLPGSTVQIPPPPRLPRYPDPDEDFTSPDFGAQNPYGEPVATNSSTLPPKRRRGMSNSSYNSSVHQQHQPYSYASPASAMSPQYGERSPSPALYQSSFMSTSSKKVKSSGYQWPQGSSQQTSYAQSSSSSRQSAGPPPGGYNSAAGSPVDREKINNAIANWLKPQIEEHADWEEYIKSKAVAPCVSMIYRQFKFVQGRIDFFHGATTPPDLPVAPKHKIGKPHVLKAMKLSTDWGAQCSETLKLISLYGPEGARYSDSRVSDLLAEHPRNGPLPQGDAIKRLLHLLREIHNDWTTEHPEDAE